MPREQADPRLGVLIRALREEAEATQEDIAYEAGITTGSLSRIEAGRANPTWTTVVRISEALGMPLVDLVGML